MRICLFFWYQNDHIMTLISGIKMKPFPSFMNVLCVKLSSQRLLPWWFLASSIQSENRCICCLEQLALRFKRKGKRAHNMSDNTALSGQWNNVRFPLFSPSCRCIRCLLQSVLLSVYVGCSLWEISALTQKWGTAAFLLLEPRSPFDSELTLLLREANSFGYNFRVTKENRGAGVLNNFEEGEKYSQHAVRKFLRNRPPQIMPSVNEFFSDPQWRSPWWDDST